MIKSCFYEDKHIDSLVDFIQQVWDKNMTKELMLKQRLQNSIENPYAKKVGFPVSIVMDDDKIVGHLLATPDKIWGVDKDYDSFWLSGLNVLPEYRRKGIAKMLQVPTNKLPIATSFWVIEATQRTKIKMGWTIVGKIPEFIKIIDTANFIKKVNIDSIDQVPNRVKNILSKKLKKLKGVQHALFISTMYCYNLILKILFSAQKSSGDIKIVNDFDDRLDRLWMRNRDSIKFAHVREHAYLNWQFKYDDGWIKIISEDKKNKIVGYAIVSYRKFEKDSIFDGLSFMSIIDIFWEFKKPQTLKGLLKFIENIAHQKKVDVILCSINNNKAKKTLFQNAFIKIPSTVYFGFHCHNSESNLSSNLNDWYITRGDADAAGTLSPNRKSQ